MKRHRSGIPGTIERALLARMVARRGSRGRRGLRSPFFKLRAYLRKMRGNPAHESSSGPLDVIWSCAGSFLGIFILAQIDALLFTGDKILLLGSFGASSLIIFGAPHSVFAQPRSVIGGQILSACAGAASYALVGEHLMLSAPLSVSLAFLMMHATDTTHPPGGATALIAGSGQHIAMEMGPLYPFMPVGSGVTLLFLLGVLINNLSRSRQYPRYWF